MYWIVLFLYSITPLLHHVILDASARSVFPK